MKKYFILLTIALFFLILPKKVLATDYYVAKNCTGISNCSTTIQAAADNPSLTARDTVKIYPGIYREIVTIKKPGTEGKPITFQAADPNDPPSIYGSESSKNQNLTWRDEGNGIYSTNLSSYIYNTENNESHTKTTNHYPDLIYETGVPTNALDSFPKTPEVNFFKDIYGSKSSGILKYQKAREPDFTVDTYWKFHENWATADGGYSVWDDADERAAHCSTECTKSTSGACYSCMKTPLADNTSEFSLVDKNTDGNGINLTSYVDLKDAIMVMVDSFSGFYGGRRKITGFSQSAGKISWDNYNSSDPLDKYNPYKGSASFEGKSGTGVNVFTKYYLEDKKEFLDQPTEWFVDKSTNKLYIKTRTGVSPKDLNLEIAVRDAGIILNGKTNITIKNINIYFVNLGVMPFGFGYPEGAIVNDTEFINSLPGNITIDNVKVGHSAQGIKLVTVKSTSSCADSLDSICPFKNVKIINSELFDIANRSYFDSSWPSAAGKPGVFQNLVFSNNHVHHIGFSSIDNEPSGVSFASPNRAIIENNYVHDTAHKCIKLTSINGPFDYVLVKDNYLERCGLNHSEASGVGTWAPNKESPTLLFMGNVIRGNYGWTYALYTSTQNSGKNYTGIYFMKDGLCGIGINQDRVKGARFYRNISVNNTFTGFSPKSVSYNNIIIGSYYGLYGGNYWVPMTYDYNYQNNIYLNNYYGVMTYFKDTALLAQAKLDYNLYEKSTGGYAYLSWHNTLYNKVCDETTNSICGNTHHPGWESHGVENSGQQIFADVASLNAVPTIPIREIKNKLRPAAGSKVIDKGTEPTEIKSLIATLQSVLGITIKDEAKNGTAYDIGALEYQSETCILKSSGDFNCDNLINESDLNALLSKWMTKENDLTGDSIVNENDLNKLLGNWKIL